MSKEKKTDKELRKAIRKQRRKKYKKIFRVILLCLIVACIYMGFRKLFPLYKEIRSEAFAKMATISEGTFKRPGNTVIYDKDGNVIGKYGLEEYSYTEIGKISAYITNGYIAKEDRNFASHCGVDFKATARAAIAYVKNKGEITQGGSTITQQVVKNNLLTQEQTYKRKLTEIALAIDVEKEYSKSKIMEIYCNTNYYGNQCYGVEGASLFYFGKHASDVSLMEAAILVATSNLPNVYNPIVDYDLSIEKAEEVLADMYECKYITKDEYDNAVVERPGILENTHEEVSETYLTTYALHCATLKVMELNGFQFKYLFESEEEYETYSNNYNSTYETSLNEVKNGGYTIYTSLDPDIQEKLQKSVDDNLSGFTDKKDGVYELQSAAVCVDNQTNMVVAIVGGREGTDYYNRGYQAERQTGSSIKPLLDYGPAIEEGYVTCGTVLEDKEVTYNNFTPKNANRRYIGEITVRQALAYSTNTIAVQLFEMTGKETCLSYLEKMKFSSLTYADMLADSISLGGFTNGMTVVDMAKGYSTIANAGVYSDNTCILSMTNYTGTVSYDVQDSTTQVFSDDTVFMLTDMLSYNFEDESGFAYNTSKQNYAGKTGTTNDSKDVWFCGFSSYYTTAVWIGYDEPKAMTNIQSSTYPVSIWTDFMESIHKNLKPKEFKIPDTVLLEDSSGEQKKVTYKKDIYKKRPSGWDYVSTRLEDLRREREEEQLKDEQLATATAAVEAFEDFQITNIEEAKTVLDYYNAACEKVEIISDTEDKETLMNRLAYKYDLLNNEVLTKWNDAIDAYNETLEDQRKAEVLEQSQQAIEDAIAYEQNEYTENVNWYIDHLNEATVYTEYIEQLIENGKAALQECEDFDNYSDLRARFNNAVKYAEELPVEEISQDETESSTED